MNRRLGLLGFFAIGGAIAIACAERLEDLAPFPCADDGTCPPSYSCIKGAGCKRGTTFDRPCDSRGSSCAEGVCIAGMCAPRCGSGDRICDPGRICSYPPPGESTPLAHCLIDCTTNPACPEGLECIPLYDDKKACVSAASKRSIDRPCAAPADCQRSGVTYLPISCARGTCAMFCSTAAPSVKCADPARACFIGDPLINSGCLTDCTEAPCPEGLSCKDPVAPDAGPRTCTASTGDGGGGGAGTGGGTGGGTGVRP